MTAPLCGVVPPLGGPRAHLSALWQGGFPGGASGDAPPSPVHSSRNLSLYFCLFAQRMFWLLFKRNHKKTPWT